MPRVSIINIEQGGEVVECQMEGANCSTVSFKFNPDDDKPGEIAENLVSGLSYKNILFPSTLIGSLLFLVF